MVSNEDLIVKLMEIGAIKFGEFKLKSGLMSPVYFDLRVIISFPDILLNVSNMIWRKIEHQREKFAVICGVPYTALPIATCICTANNMPMVIRRKEAKDYGTKKMIEGYYENGSNCLIIEDVVTSGSSVFETAVALRKVGLQVTDAVVLLNREQGGKQMLERENITLHSIFTISEVLACLLKKEKISEKMAVKVRNFIDSNNTFKPKESITGMDTCESTEKIYPITAVEDQRHGLMRLEERAKLCTNQVARKIFQIMCDKRSNLCLSADVNSAVELVEIADVLGPHICILKTHVDILDHPSPSIGAKLKDLSEKHNFVLFEDRKFADIGSTVKHQYSAGTYSISKWAQLTNAHSIPGPGVIEGLRAAVSGDKDRACLLIAQMSSQGNLANGDYTKATVKMAEEHDDFVIGFICTSKVSDDPKFLHLTPGVKLQTGIDKLGQQYLTPDEVIRNRKCDIVIVGRGITLAANRLEAAIEYKTAAWQAYLHSLEGRR